MLSSKYSTRLNGVYYILFRIVTIVIAISTILLLLSFDSDKQVDPLPSWNNGESKLRILQFVKEAVSDGSKGFVRPEDRIVVFDNDGTLWQEEPAVEMAYVIASLKNISRIDSTLKTRQPYKAALEGNKEYLKKGGIESISQLLKYTHANKSVPQFQKEVRQFLDTATHPRWKVKYTKLVYQPMLELIDYLKQNGFQIWICSGGTINFMRVFTEGTYGIPPQQVIGTELKLTYKQQTLWQTDSVLFLNDKIYKPVGINNHIGRIPVITIGNERSGGDLYMLGYSQSRKGPSLQMIINHDDNNREFEYQEKDSISLKTAAKNGWTVISIKDDWNQVFVK